VASILGISGLYHDAAAALVVDGKIVCALQEERVSRIKNDPSLPFRAARACLDFAGLDPAALDSVMFYESPFDKLERVLSSSLRGYPGTAKALPRVLRSQWGSKLWVLDHLAEGLGVARCRVSHVHHHESHAKSAFSCSPFARAAVLTVDGVGEQSTTSIWHGVDGELRLVEEIHFPHSLGLFYSAITAYLGFLVNEGEYKVMGLAAWGEARYEEEFSRLLRTHPDGSFELDVGYFDPHGAEHVGFSGKLEELLGARRPYGKAWSFREDGTVADEETRRFADIAASAQVALEKALVGLVRRALERTGERDLCLAGGVALNAKANGVLSTLEGVGRVFVQPAAGDAGGALGAALLGSSRAGDPPSGALASAALGLPPDPNRAQHLATSLGLSCRRVSDPHHEAATRLERGEIVAWVQGRSEWGPRALGQRSLLIRPDRLELRDRLNRVVKQRESFRPFAPAFLDDAAERWVEGAPNDMTRFMTTVCPVKEGAPLEAAIHKDGTARVQTVREDTAFGQLLRSLEREGLPPALINTSLNDNGQPIVLSEADALLFFLRKDIEALFVEDVLIQRSSSSGPARSRKEVR
jgi:carbamoyltransferase